MAAVVQNLLTLTVVSDCAWANCITKSSVYIAYTYCSARIHKTCSMLIHPAVHVHEAVTTTETSALFGDWHIIEVIEVR